MLEINESNYRSFPAVSNSDAVECEVWEDIEGFEGLYEVSNRGRVKSHDMPVKYPTGTIRIQQGRLLSLGKSSWYARVNLRKNGEGTPCNVHRLVAKAFLPNPDNKPEVNHINGIKSDNRVENLEWTTGSENMKHAFRTNLNAGPRDNYNASTGKDLADLYKKPVIRCNDKGDHLETYGSIKDALVALGKSIRSGDIGMAIKTNRRSYGYKWEYA